MKEKKTRSEKLTIVHKNSLFCAFFWYDDTLMRTKLYHTNVYQHIHNVFNFALTTNRFQYVPGGTQVIRVKYTSSFD